MSEEETSKNEAKRFSWYPGHIKAAEDELKNKWLPLLDLVVELVDSRVPISGKYPNQGLWKSKKIISVYTKKDLSGLVLPSNQVGLVLNAHLPHIWRQKLVSLILAHSTDILEKLKKQGRKRNLRIGVCGLPNVGKSTFLNSLGASTKKAKTGDKPGVTRQVQWINCKDFDLLDTPGLMPLAVDQETAYKLALCNLLPEKLFDKLTLAEKLFALLEEIDPELLAETKLADLQKDEKKAYLFIRKFQEGKLGKIYLDSFKS